MKSETGFLLCCGGFGLILVVQGTVMIVSKRGSKVFDLNHPAVEGREAVNQGSVAVFIGLILIGISIWINLQG